MKADPQSVKPTILFLLLWLLACLDTQAAVKGPEFVEAGNIAVFTSDKPTAWAVVPESYSESVYIDSDGKSLIFASPVQGAVTVIGATAGDGDKPNIEVRTFYNGTKGIEPEPGTLANLTRAEIGKIDASVQTIGCARLAAVFEKVVDGIEQKIIRTPEGARETFRRYWEYEAARTGNGTLEAFRPAILKISNAIDWKDAESVKKDFQDVIKGLK